MRASGSYWKVIDESYTSSGGISLSAMIPMMLKKGKKISTVTLSTFESLVGYDLSYNPLYLGLKEALGTYKYLTVFRLNKDPLYGNLVVTRRGKTFSFQSVKDEDAFFALVKNVSATKEVSTFPVTINLNADVVAGSVLLKVGTTTVATDDGAGNLVAVGESGIVGTLDYVTGDITLTAGTASTIIASGELDVAHNLLLSTPGAWASICTKLQDYKYSKSFSSGLSLNIGESVEADSVLIYDSVGNLVAHSSTTTIVADNASGITGTIDNTTGEITLAAAVASATTVVKYVPATASKKLYSLTVYSLESGLYTILEEITVSFESTSEYFIENFVSENLIWQQVANPISASYGISEPVLLANAGDGTLPSASDLDLSDLVNYNGFLIAMNGLASYGLIQKFQDFADANDRLCLIDSPNFKTYYEALAWRLGLKATNLSALFEVTDQQLVDGKSFSVYPSIKVLKAYATMYKETGYLCYPPAGYNYAAVTAESLFKNDFINFRDELKINKMNYIWQGPSGPVIWEQRTLQAAESDLSYIHANVILIMLAQQLVRFGANFDFKLIGPSDLNVIQSGLEEIVGEYKQLGFLWSGTVHVPTWAQVLAEGVREAVLTIAIKIAEDSEERTFAIILNRNAA